MWPNPQFPADLISFTEEILNGKLHFLCIAHNKTPKISQSLIVVVITQMAVKKKNKTVLFFFTTTYIMAPNPYHKIHG